MPQDLIDAARTYLDAGLSIISLTGKRPNTHFHPQGLLNPITGRVETEGDAQLLATIFDHPTTSGVAILIPHHFLVADVDSDDAAALLMDLCGGEVPGSPTAKTRNGLHVWFYAPGAERSLWLGGRTLLFRGAGSYVAAPPSRHPDGGVYTWLWPLVGPSGIIGSEPPVGIADLPDAAMARIANAQLIADAERRKVTHTEWHAEHEDGTWVVRPREVQGTIGGLARAVSEAESGNRNNMLAWAAMQAAEEGVPFEEAMEALSRAAIDGAGLGARETSVTIKAAYRRRGPKA